MGYVLVAPRRPSEADQLAALARHGLAPEDHQGMDAGPVYVDRVKRTSKRPAAQLVERAAMVHTMPTAAEGEALMGGVVVIASPLCAGLTDADARAFAAALAERDVTLRVDRGVVDYPPGADVSEVAAEVDRAARAAAMQRMRAKKRGK